MTTDVRIPRERDLSEGRMAVRRTHLVEEVSEARLRALKRPHRRRLLVWIVVPAILAMGSAFAYLALRPAEEIVHGIGCFDAPRVQSNTTVVNPDGRHPAEICSELWEEGIVTYPVTPAAAPPLMACVPPRAGVVWVFPGSGEDFCESLGLTDLPEDFVEVSAAFAALRDDLEAALGAFEGRCTEGEEARQITRRVLDDHGYEDWTIRAEGFTEARPCAYLALDAATKEAHLVPEEREGG